MADQKETIFSITGQEKNVIDVSTSSVNSSSNTEGNNSIYVNDECHSMYFIWKDVLIISLGFLCNFIAFNGLSNVQSSLNSNEGLGSASLGVIYAALIISSFILPSMLVKRFGCKWTMVVCIPFYTLYMLANFYATWYTLMPASVLVGLAAAPLWSSKCSCLTTLSHHYAKLSGEAPEVVNARFFGVFFMILHFDQIIGNLISSFALNSPNDVSSSLLYSFDICGISYCNENLDINVSTTMNNSSGLVTRNRPPLSQIYLMCGIYAALSLSGAVIIALFVRPLKNFQSSTSDLEGLALFKASLYHTINPLQLMMVPLTIFSGLAQSYMTSDFTKAFVNCVMGIHYIGFVMITTGVMDAAFSLIFGIVLKYVHRSVVYTIGAVLCLSLYITMMIWTPSSSISWPFYVIAGFWGIADSVWQTHFNAFYGVLFKDNLEVAFASYRLWESIGYMIGFVWSDSVCVNIKLYVLVPLLLVGMLSYGGVEFHLRKKIV